MVQNCTELHRIAHTSENDSGGGNATMTRMTTMPPQRVRMEFLHWSTIALVIVAYVLNATHIFATAQGEQDDAIEETNSYILDKDLPKFGEPIQNLTVPVGREAVLTCVINNLQTYKVAWLRVDTQTILTIQTHVITKNHRMTIAHVEGRAWVLRIRDVKESDKGWYMCQVNTDPMRNQIGYLNVVVPPNILDYPTSTDMVVREGSNVTLKCAASGSPTPSIIWRREGNEPISAGATSLNSSTFSISRVNRLHMGAYLCIASNGIPPSVSKRVMLIVHFPPMIWIQDQLVGAALGQRLTLECQSEAYPRSINYWMKNDTIITQGKHFEPSIKEINSYKVVMKLTIKDINIADFGTYKCVVKNSLGETDGSIKVYHIPSTTTIATSPPATTTVATTTEIVFRKNYKNKIYRPPLDDYSSSSNKIIGIGDSSETWNIDGTIEKDRDPRYRDNGASFTEDQREKEAFVDTEGNSRACSHGWSTGYILLVAVSYMTVLYIIRCR
ncbi:lachesin-like isoform X1 [Anopheles merus]|uniref:lachesin-like isoform X1 n=2 Tax=Anopheles merus TaxID=30066 RepID=UPI001BE3ECB4|nr:lachesin-like isoform X1 [Anopheles merus]XP_041778641.1 lachesin-like isoform X1 [Anopheles merus]XP_041778642.1 lachesin-like isoform X1 [Anopheles merus]XP_041778643.1 lachesin-like isoform X1 [Anopheles merus]XP_041778644.1 lachesin-like isoform X1 [Anopheles merus]XP_041778645.1 lachesin-like isoform X1 [Anopheles merus]XP_041778646.1 lachesin-like isoform X1 [Anopheles merus]XP_041778647.1 lachesin-like isoform X1 [Anopheles merus]XP_041778648.1 lachesin-like isoform X1 [Anopheles 